MNLPDILTNTKKHLKSHSPEILTALGVSGVLSTSYLVARATFVAADAIASQERSGSAPTRKERLKERFPYVWRLYVPAACSGVVTISCIVGASKANSKRTTAAVTAYSLTELAFSEYKDKVVEQIGVGKEQKVRDEIAQDRVNRNPAPAHMMGDVIVMGDGNVLCCEEYTGRYFWSNMEALRKANNDINSMINSERYVTLNEFYELVGLEYTSESDLMGWDADKQMHLGFSSVLAQNGKPCLSFAYNYVKPLK